MAAILSRPQRDNSSWPSDSTWWPSDATCWPSDATWRRRTGSSFCLFGTGHNLGIRWIITNCTYMKNHQGNWNWNTKTIIRENVSKSHLQFLSSCPGVVGHVNVEVFCAEIRRYYGRLISSVGFHIIAKQHLYGETRSKWLLVATLYHVKRFHSTVLCFVVVILS